jgi:hypothetical protein
MLIVDNLSTDIDGSSIEFKRLFNGHYGSVNACAISTRRS